jgi:hypothetical protein
MHKFQVNNFTDHSFQFVSLSVTESNQSFSQEASQYMAEYTMWLETCTVWRRLAVARCSSRHIISDDIAKATKRLTKATTVI